MNGAPIEGEFENAAALRAHRTHFEAMVASHGSVIEFGKEAVKAVALISGGAAVACLAFLGQIAVAGNGTDIAARLAPALTTSLAMFGIAVAVSAFASGFSYSAQFFFQCASQASTLSWSHPYVSRKGWAACWVWVGAIMQILAAFSVVVCYGLICWGLWHAYDAFRVVFPG